MALDVALMAAVQKRVVKEKAYLYPCPPINILFSFQFLVLFDAFSDAALRLHVYYSIHSVGLSFF